MRRADQTGGRVTDTKRRVLFLHDPKLLDPGELEAVRDHTPWAVGESVLDVRAGDLVIARHTVWPWPRRVARDIARQGGELLNGTSAYVYADTPVSWSYDLGDLTPRTWTDFSRLPAAAAFIVKGAKADKSRWDRMFARNAYAARELMAELARETASRGEELVAREYVPLERLGGTPGGCPVCTEFRIFIADGEVLAAGFYWDPADCERAPPPPEEIPPEFVRAALDRLEENGCPLRYYALDVARKADGGWMVVEVNDGQRSGLSTVDPVALYGRLATVLGR